MDNLNIDIIAIFGFIAASLAIPLIAFYMGKRENNTIWIGFSLFIVSGLWIMLFVWSFDGDITNGTRIANIVSTESTFNITTSTISIPDYSYSVISGTNILTIRHDGNNTRTYGELITASSSILGENVECIAIPLIKSASPTGIAIAGIFDVNNGIVHTFGSIDVSTLTTIFEYYEFCGDTLHTLQSGDRIGISWRNGTSDATNFIRTTADTTDPFNSENTIRTQYTTGWNTTSGQDMNAQYYVYLEYPNNVQVAGIGGVYNYESNPIEFSQELKIMFMLIAALSGLLGATSISSGRSGGFKPFDRVE